MASETPSLSLHQQSLKKDVVSSSLGSLHFLYPFKQHPLLSLAETSRAKNDAKNIDINNKVKALLFLCILNIFKQLKNNFSRPVPSNILPPPRKSQVRGAKWCKMVQK